MFLAIQIFSDQTFGLQLSILDRNFVQVYPGVPPQSSLKDVSVYPNPYIVRAEREDEFTRLIRFNYLTSDCRITIFTVTGEVVAKIEHNSSTLGYTTWDARTVNNQEVAPGLYIFHVESNNGEEKIGKFAVIR